MPAFQRIVLAEDDPDDTEIFKDAVKEICPAIELMTVEDGGQLINLLEKIPPPDAVIIDINMPVLNGFQCVRIIRENPRYHEITIIVYSTASRKKDIDYCFDLGANHYITKPNSAQAINTFVNGLCSGQLKTISR